MNIKELNFEIFFPPNTREGTAQLMVNITALPTQYQEIENRLRKIGCFFAMGNSNDCTFYKTFQI